MVVLGLSASAAVGDLKFRFSSPGPDRYADGSDVLPGECYALVWTRDGATFEGFAADGTAANPADSAVLMLAPVATQGANGMHCPEVLFQLDESLAASCQGGTLTVCLVDARTTDGEKKALSGLDEDGKPRLIEAWGTVEGATTARVEGRAKADAAMGTSHQSAVPAGTERPRITGIRKAGDKVFLTVAGTVPYLQYNATAGATPEDARSGANAAEAPKNGVAGEDVILVVPAKGDTGFFSVNRN